MAKHIKSPINFESERILTYLEEQGVINLEDIQAEIEKAKVDAIIRAHPYKIYQGKDKRWYTYVPDETKSDGRKKLAKPTLDKLHQAIYGYYQTDIDSANSTDMTLLKLYPRWLTYKELHTQKTSYLSRIETDWKKYYLGTKIVEIPIKDLTRLMLDEWTHTLIKEYSMTKKTYYNVTLIMRQALTYAVDLGIIKASPMDNIKPDGKRLFRKVRKRSNETQVYTKDELEQLKTMAWEDFHNRTKVYQLAPLAALFMFYTGLRISEVLTVRYDDLEQNGQLHISRMLCRDSKEVIELTKGTCGDRDVLLTREALHIIQCAKERQQELCSQQCEYIFSITDQPPSYHSVADLFRKYCRNMGIDRKSSHKARKTYISTLIDGGVNINTIREMVGHADERTTYGNYCFDRDTNAEKRAKIEQALSTKSML